MSDKPVAGLASALAFLSRIAPPPSGPKFSIAPGWFGVAGLAIGLPCAGVAWLACLLAPGADPIYALLGAWAWLSMEIWLSYGLHWDGVADLADASGARGKDFWQIMRDSRIGTYGVLAILLLFAGQLLALACHLSPVVCQSGNWRPVAVLALAPAWARLAPIWLAWLGYPYAKSGLGAALCGQITPKTRLACALSAFAILFPLWLLGCHALALLALCLGQYLLISRLWAMGRSHGGLSGDFFGAAIETSQCLFLLFTIPVC